jgi:hypothetical protein
MIERAPPKLALWLLKVWGSPYRNEALAGDLIEQYQEGRSRAWYWRQVIAAILGARWRFIRTMPWTAAGRLVSRLLAETAAVLSLAVVADQARRAHSLAQMMNHTFISTLIMLIVVAAMGLLVSIPPRRKQVHAGFHALLLTFGVIALGAGTLTWADTLRGDSRPTPVCVCPND